MYCRGMGNRRPEVFSTAVLFVGDLDAAVDFYHQLGMLVDIFDSTYAIVRLGDEELAHLQVVDQPTSATVYFNVPDVDVWHRRCVDGDLPATQVENRSWGMREFIATDPSGNRIRVGTNT